MDTHPRTRILDVLIFDDVNLLDVAGPVQAFDIAHHEERKVYRHRYVSLDGRTVCASCGLNLSADDRLSADSPADDLLIPGGDGVDALLADEVLLDIVRKKANGPPHMRLISICSGALVLAAAGVLNGQRATTHWSRENQTRAFPDVVWDLDRISVSNERVFTSAGVTTGIDLALAIIRADCGNTVALNVARELVVQLRRTGGQSQYAMHLASQFTEDDRISQLVEAVVTRPDRDWSLDQLAEGAGLNSRTLSRRFRQHMNLSPGQFVERTRIDHARGLLADGLPLKTVAAKSGFGDVQRMRRAFQRRFGVSVADYASVFGEGGETVSGFSSRAD